MNMELILERENWDLQKIKDYISDFKTMEEFHKSPKARAIISWVSKHRGPNGEKLYIKDLLSGLGKKGARRKSIQSKSSLVPLFDRMEP